MRAASAYIYWYGSVELFTTTTMADDVFVIWIHSLCRHVEGRGMFYQRPTYFGDNCGRGKVAKEGWTDDPSFWSLINNDPSQRKDVHL